ncbi:MAG: FAD:protein FMN transferase, partial [Gammaproteobacteria bacterium]
MALAAALLAAAVVLPAWGAWVGADEDLMGTRVSVELWHENEAQGQVLVREVMAEYRRIDASMSTYKADSEISAINQAAASGPVATGEELFNLISRSVGLSMLSAGAFDITYESVGYLYDFRARRR